MCGIFGCIGRSSGAPERVLVGLKLLEYRGYDSWGVAFSLPNKKVLDGEKHVGKIGGARLQQQMSHSTLALGHTRWATHGGVTEVNAHPHYSIDKSFAIVHNGIIENAAELKHRLLSLGHTFISQTDTEVFVRLVEEELKTNSLIDAFHKSFQQIAGMNAIALISSRESLLLALRRGSPLVIGKSEHDFFVASDPIALQPSATEIAYLEDNELVVFQEDTATLFDNSEHKKPIAWRPLKLETQNLDLGKYPHFMLKEIHEQPEILRQLAHKQKESIEHFSHNLSKEIVFVGCGTASYAALLATYLLASIARRLSRNISGSELTTFREVLSPESFVTFISQSGETIDLLEHVPYLNDQHLSFGAIVNRQGSSLDRASKHTLYLNAGTEQCVLATKSFTAQAATVFLLAQALAGTYSDGASQLLDAALAVESVLKDGYVTHHILPLAEKLSRSEKLFIIGRGIYFPLALEAALKIKEVTYIHAEGLSGGELKHGVIALIEPETPCLIFLPSGSERAAMLSNAIELKSRGATIIGIGDEPDEAFDIFLPVPKVGVLNLLPSIVIVQLLAYSMALKLGNDPDKPRNLAKSVTVK